MALLRTGAQLAASKSSRKSSSSSKSSKDGEEYEAPQVNLLQEGRDAMTLAGEAYPFFLNLNRQYGADYARNEVDVAEARSVAEQRAIQNQSLGLRSSLLGGSPEISAANQSMMDRLAEQGPSDLETELSDQALADLRKGGNLSAEDARAAVQQARAASSARGLSSGQSSAIAEVLNRQQFSDQRRDQRRGFASAIDAQRTGRRSTDAAISNNAFNTLGSFWDPQMRMFGKGGSQVTGQTTGPNAFQPYLNSAVDVAQGNQTAQTESNRLNELNRQFNLERQDSAYYSERNLKAGNANAAAARSNATTNAAIGAGASILAYAALAFL